MNLTRLIDKRNELLEGRENYNPKGSFCGFDGLGELFSLKKGYPLFIAGDAHSGKTEFVLEILVTSSELYGWKHYCYFGETGSDRDIFAELCTKYIGKQFYKKSQSDYFAMTDIEAEQSMTWVNEHFFLMPSTSRFTIEEFYDSANKAEKELDLKFDTTIIDPIGDCVGWKYELEYLNSKYIHIRHSSAKNKRMDIIVNHVGDTMKLQEKGGMKRHKLPAIPDEWAGGKANYRAGFQMLLYYRPALWMLDDDGKTVEKNEAWVYCQKSKPKGVGKVGMVKMYWDFKKNRFYEKDFSGVERYARKESNFKQIPQQQPIQNNIEFLNINERIEPETDNNDLPY